MTPEERDRLTRLEVEVEQQRQQIGSMDTKLDRLLDAAAMGRGAWWIILKLGGLLVLIATGAAYAYDYVMRH